MATGWGIEQQGATAGLTPLENYSFQNDAVAMYGECFEDTTNDFAKGEELPVFDEDSLKDLCTIVDREMRERIRVDKLKYFRDAGLPLDMQTWSVFQCACWFRWMTGACGLEDTFSNDVIRNGLDGQLLSAMTEGDFKSIFSGHTENDIVFQTFQYWKSVHVDGEDVYTVGRHFNKYARSSDLNGEMTSLSWSSNQDQNSNFPFYQMYPSNMHVTSNDCCGLRDHRPLTQAPPPFNDVIRGMVSQQETHERGYDAMGLSSCHKNVKRNRSKTQPLLWKFILECLNNQKMTKSLQWVNKRDGTFKFFSKHKEEVAHAWGKLKNRKRMTYQKMARAMRDYAGKGIMKKVKRKLHYRFFPNVLSQYCFGLTSPQANRCCQM